jgi:type II secretory pathway component PulC
MAGYRSILILGIVSALLIAGCKKLEAPKASRRPEPKKESLEQLEKQEMEYLLNELRKKNPFRPDHVSSVIMQPEGGTDLKGIVWDKQKPFAIIGDTVAMEGDSVDGKKVIKINKDSVVLEEEGRQVTLRLEAGSE